MDTSTKFRLPRNTVPTKYSIRIRPNFEMFTFEGTESIEISVREVSNSIILNAAELSISSLSVTQGDRQFSCTSELDEANERVVISVAGELQLGNATIEISFSGSLNDQLSGFYRSQFTTETGESAYIATTQFEATDARKAFPCYDEPDLKAIFSIQLEAPNHYLAVSNAPEQDVTNIDDGYKRVSFKDTIPMSTYLVAFIVGPLEASEIKTSGDVPIRIISKPGQRHLYDFAQNVASHALEFFTEWFSIPYPGEKLDLIAIPDFAFGAMENLGAVTFRETLLLVDPERSSRAELERIVDVICHEIAHMWFGDLVTMKWWNGLWLNEAFATFMELLATDAYNPSWNRWVSFGLSKGAALAIDGLHNTRSIEFKVEQPSDAEGMFDVLTYEKGASVLRMLERYLGESTFRSGITKYLNAHRFDNAETTDLWQALEEASGEPISQIMVGWVFQGGYPLIRVRTSGSTIELSQEPFAYMTDASKAGLDDASSSMVGSAWKVPMSIKIGNEVHNLLLENETLSLPLQDQDALVVANYGGWGFFRVNYDEELLGRILANFSTLDDLEKFNLASDIWSQTLSLRCGIDTFFKFVEAIEGETEPSLWETVISSISLMHLMADSDQRNDISRICKKALLPILEKVGFEPEDGEKEGTSRLRASVISALGTIGRDLETISECKSLFVKEMSVEADIDPDIIASVLGVVAANGDEAEFAFMLDRYRHPSTPQEENRYLMALTHFEHPVLVKKVLEMTLGEIRSQNGPFVIASLLSGPMSGAETWKFLIGHWEELLEKFPDNTISRMLSGITALVAEDSYRLESEILSFFDSHKLPSGEKSLRQTLERYKVNLAFRRELASTDLSEFAT